jgi:hypothetical protein
MALGENDLISYEDSSEDRFPVLAILSQVFRILAVITAVGGGIYALWWRNLIINSVKSIDQSMSHLGIKGMPDTVTPDLSGSVMTGTFMIFFSSLVGAVLLWTIGEVIDLLLSMERNSFETKKLLSERK